jgi:creatinine amidohydrolase/Fe(II)-dependent formamide hydrolase-like protein
VKFRGTRDLASLTAFINEHGGNIHQVKMKNDLLDMSFSQSWLSKVLSSGI